MDISEYKRIRTIILKMESERDRLQEKYKGLKKDIADLKIHGENLKKALAIIQLVAQKTQDNLKYHISNLVTTALKSISSKYPKLAMDIVARRNQTEVDLNFEEQNIKQDPFESSGYGPVDIAAYALRMSIWCLNKTRAFFGADEPFSHLSGDKTNKASGMLKMMSDKLKMQKLIISHDPDIGDYADRVFYVDKKDDISIVTMTLINKGESDDISKKQKNNSKDVKRRRRRKPSSGSTS